MQIFSHQSIASGIEALEDEFDSQVEDHLEGQNSITLAQVKDAWLTYNHFQDYLMLDLDEYDIDITSFNNSIYGHLLSQFPSLMTNA